jgi:phytoene synthase
VSRDTSFYYSFLVLPPRKRKAIIAVWDFCRAVDDAVDEAASATAARDQVAAWRAELDAVYNARPRTPQGLALRPVVQEFALPRAHFDALVEGVEMDLGHPRYQTFEALLEYCRRVASAVGLICIEIFGYTDPRTRDYAERLGIALQLTNIIRDVAADLRRGRIYLPLDDLERFAVTEEDLRRGVVTPPVRDLLAFECARARQYFGKASAALSPADAGSLLAAEIMGAIYFEILQRVERAGYDVFSRRIRVTRPRRAVLALTLWARRRLRSS